jgi:hypothetical protein
MTTSTPVFSPTVMVYSKESLPRTVVADSCDVTKVESVDVDVELHPARRTAVTAHAKIFFISSFFQFGMCRMK